MDGAQHSSIERVKTTHLSYEIMFQQRRNWNDQIS
jgi:hypothetical protein